MSPALARFTRLLVILVCAGLVARGWDLLRYDRVAKGAGVALSDGLYAQAPPLIQDLEPWAHRRGVKGEARSLQVRLSQLAGGPLGDEGSEGVDLEPGLMRFLMVYPADSMAWLALAQVRWAKGQTDDALKAWRLAALVAPREGYALPDRVMFGVERWPELTEDDQRRVLRDIAIVAQANEVAGRLRGSLSRLAPDRQREVALALSNQGAASGGDLKRLGLPVGELPDRSP
jgi:hypothetical protein